MSEARINRISNELGTGGPVVSGITTFSGLNYFVPPSGTTAQRPQNCPSGSIRFNTDSAHLEYFDGLQWLEFEAFNNELGVSGALGNRGLFDGAGTANNIIDYITISTLGNALDFGDLSVPRQYPAACSSSTRAVFGGGYGGSGNTSLIDFVTIASTGNAATFGNLTQSRSTTSACSSATRGLWGGGRNPTAVNTIDYITIASTGNAVSFGSLTSATFVSNGGCSSSTRGIFSLGAPSGSIDYITIATTGNSINFGNLSVSRSVAACSNATRALFGGGYITNIIDFVTIASTGNAVDFGDLTQGRFEPGACASSIRAVWGGGYIVPSVNTIDFVTIATTGNATDFGDRTTTSARGNGSCSNGHGGL